VILRVAALHYRGYELIQALLTCSFGFGCVVAPLQSLILARVPPTAAGSASGVLATIQQVGSAVGVALIGVLLFGRLASDADAASGRALPRLERSLAGLALPLPAVHAITTAFQTCFHDRFRQDDPYATPASCQSAPNRVPPTLARPVGLAIAHAATQARRENYLGAIEVTLRFQLAVYLLCFVLVGILPRRPVGRRGEATRSEDPVSRSAVP